MPNSPSNIDGVDITADFATFRNQITHAYGGILYKMIVHLITRASWEKKNNQPYNALKDAESAVHFLQYLSGVKLPGLFGFIAELYLDLDEKDNASLYYKHGLGHLDESDPGALADKALFARIKQRLGA